MASGLADPDPDRQLRAAIATCLALRDDPAAAAAAVAEAGWTVAVRAGSGIGYAVYQSGALALSLGDDAQVCSVLSSAHPTSAMQQALADALAGAGLAIAATGQDAKGCAVQDLGDGRSVGLYGSGAEFLCSSDKDSNFFLYPTPP